MRVIITIDCPKQHTQVGTTECVGDWSLCVRCGGANTWRVLEVEHICMRDDDGAQAAQDRVLIKDLRDEVASLKHLLGNDRPWPLVGVLRVLVDAAGHLLIDHDCDNHGHEVTREAMMRGRAYADRIEMRFGAPVGELEPTPRQSAPLLGREDWRSHAIDWRDARCVPRDAAEEAALIIIALLDEADRTKEAVKADRAEIVERLGKLVCKSCRLPLDSCAEPTRHTTCERIARALRVIAARPLPGAAT